MFNLDKYRSVIWRKGGREFPFLDCYGVINEIRRDLKLAPWPELNGVTIDDNGLDAACHHLVSTGTLQCCEPAPGVAIACYAGSVVTHVAIVVSIDGQLRAVECNPGMNVSSWPLARFVRRFLKVEFYQ